MASSPDFKSQPKIFRQDSIGPNVNLLDQYRAKLKEAIGTARFYGLPDRPLEKVFVELTVIEDFEIPRDAEYKALMDKELRRHRTLFPKDEIEEDIPEEVDGEDRMPPLKVRWTVTPEKLLKPGKRSQVVGAPGCGKTTLMRWLALQTINSTHRLPVFIELKALNKAQLDSIDDNFSTFLFQQGVKSRFDRTTLTPEQFTAIETAFREYDKSGCLVVLLDGLDEIAEAERHRLQTAVEKYSNSHKDGLTLIVSTRPYGYLRNLADLKVLEIEPLSDVQIGQFLDHWCEKPAADTVKADLWKNSNLRNLARCPFLLTCIASLDSGGEIPRIELYRQIVAGFITRLDWDQGDQKLEIDDPNGVLKHRFLKRFAFDQLFEKLDVECSSRLVFHTEEILHAAQTFLREEDPAISPLHLVHDVCATPLLREIEVGRFMFAHPTIHEFLAAEELSERDDRQKRFARAFFKRQLAEMDVLPMTIGLADDPNKFYEFLSRLPESFDFIRLCLEGRSLGYHQKAVQNGFYQTWMRKLADFWLEKRSCEIVFGDVILSSFTGSEANHSTRLASGFLTGLRDQNPLVRRSAAEALGKFGSALSDAVAAIAGALHDPDPYVSQRAVEVLGQIGNAPPDVILALSDALHNKNCQSAANALGQLGNVSPDAVRVLVEALRSQNPEVRYFAAHALGDFALASPHTVHTLTEVLHDQFPEVRFGAATALGKFSLTSTDAVRALIEALRDQNPYVRHNVVHSLGILGNAPADIIAAIVEALHDQDSHVRQSAAVALGELGTAYPEVITALSDALGDQDPEVRQNAAEALAQLRVPSPNAVHTLTGALRDEDSGVRRLSATDALGKLGKASPDVITALSKTLCDEDEYVRHFAADALIQLGHDSPEVLGALSEDFRNEDRQAPQLAAEKLGKLGNASPAIVATLAEAIRDEDWLVRLQAAEALERIGFDSPIFLEGLKLLLSDPDPELQKMALRSIGYPSTDPGLLDDLKKLTASDNSEIREAAEDAYEKYKFKLEVLGLLPA